jgi:uncharacterized protein YkwD
MHGRGVSQAAPTSVRLPVVRVAFLAVAALALTVAVGASARSTASFSVEAGWGTNRPDLAAQVVQQVNTHRASKGLSALSVSPTLTASSVWKSLHMAGQGYFAHDDPAPPVGRGAHRRALDCGYGGSRWGENIAYGYGSPGAVMNGWLGSSGHRANIESASYTTIGVGVAQRTGGTLYWTQNFGNDASAASPPRSPSLPQPAAPTPPAPIAAAPSPAVTSAASIGALPAKTTRARAGSRLLAAVPFVQLGSKRRIVAGGVRCRAEVDGRRLRVVVNAFRNGMATCAWLVPRAAAGEPLVGIVAVQIGATAAIRRFERLIR